MNEDIGEIECERLKEVTEDDLKIPDMNVWKGYVSENIFERRNFIFDKVQSFRETVQPTDGCKYEDGLRGGVCNLKEI